MLNIILNRLDRFLKRNIFLNNYDHLNHGESLMILNNDLDLSFGYVN